MSLQCSPALTQALEFERTGEGRIHPQNVAYELVIGVVIGEVVEDDEGVEQRDAKHQREFRDTKRHRPAFCAGGDFEAADSAKVRK